MKFDVITFFEVLEHQDDPVEFLEAIKRMLKPEGWIAGSVTNRDSLAVKLSRKLPSRIDFPPNHLLRFNLITIERVFSLLGFSEIKIKEISSNTTEYSKLIQALILGIKINRFLKLKIVNSEYVGEVTLRQVTIYRRLIFLSLKKVRDLILFPITIVMKKFAKGLGIFFNVRY